MAIKLLVSHFLNKKSSHWPSGAIKSFFWGENYSILHPKLQEQVSHTINPIKSVFSLIFIFYGLNLTGGSSGEKLFGCLIASLPAR